MAYVLGAATSDRIEIGGASITSTTMSIAAWVYVTTLSSNKGFFGSKPATGNVSSVVQLRMSGTTGNVEMRVSRATTSLSYITNDTPLATTKLWKFVCGTFDTSTGAHIYTGSQATPVVESAYGTSTTGTGSMTADNASGNAMWGNANGSGTITNGMTGRMGWGQVYNRVLTIAEVEWLRQFPRGYLPGCLNFINMDRGLVDLSGAGNHGYAIGANQSDVTPVLGNLAAFPRKSRFGLTAAGSFNPSWAARSNQFIGWGVYA